MRTLKNILNVLVVWYVPAKVIHLAFRLRYRTYAKDRAALYILGYLWQDYKPFWEFVKELETIQKTLDN